MTKTKKIWVGAGTLAGAAVLTVGGLSTAFADGATGSSGGAGDDKPLTGNALAQASDAALRATGGGTVTDTETSDDNGSAYEVTVVDPDGQEVDVELDESFTVANQEIDDDTDTPLTGDTLSQANDAAIKAAGGGTVTEAETSDTVGAAYEVDVLTADGQEVEVELDQSFAVVGQQSEKADSGSESEDAAESGNGAAG